MAILYYCDRIVNVKAGLRSLQIPLYLVVLKSVYELSSVWAITLSYLFPVLPFCSDLFWGIQSKTAKRSRGIIKAQRRLDREAAVCADSIQTFLPDQEGWAVFENSGASSPRVAQVYSQLVGFLNLVQCPRGGRAGTDI